MKKLSISLFAVLAIAFAVTSAFTTKAKFARSTYKMWAFSSTSGATQTDYNAVTGTPLVDKQYDYINGFTRALNQTSNSTQTISQFLSNNFKSCQGSTEVCAVKILEEPSTPINTDGAGEVLDVAFGALQ